MQKNHGITLVSLVITIIVLLILTSVATYSGLNVVNSSKLTAFTTELKIMQTQVNAIYEEDSGKQIGKEITGDIQIQANKIFTESESGIVSQEGYRYWSQDLIKELGIEGVEQDFFVNLEKRSVVSYQGLKYEGKTYYTLNQVPNGLYNVEYENPNQGKPSFQISQEKLSDGKWKITVFDIQYTEGYINKWKVRYQLEGKESWNTANDLSFVVDQMGTYKIQLVNGEVISEEKELVIESEYVKDGLILHYDAINNIGEGDDKHSTTTTVWKDLSGNSNDAVLYDCTINENSIEFNGTSSYGKLPTKALGDYNASTIEVVMEKNTDESAILLADNANVSNRGLALGDSFLYSWIGSGNSDTISYYFIINKPVNNEKHTYTVLYDGVDYNNTIAYQDNISLNKSGNKDGFSNNTDYPIIGKRQWQSGSPRNFKGKIYSIRVYNKKLNEKELQANYQIDKNRFNIE